VIADDAVSGDALRVVAAALTVSLATRAAAVHAPPRCTVHAAPGDDLQRVVDRVRTPAVVCLDAGEFRLAWFLRVVRDGIVLRGAGPATVVRLADGVQSPVVVIGQWDTERPRRTTARVRLERLRVVGGGPDGPEALPGHPYLTNSAIVVRGARDVTIRDVSVTACRSACILTEHDVRRIAIVHADVGGAVWDGVALNRTSGARITGSTIHENGAAGISTEHLVDGVIADDVVRDNRTHGVYLSDSYRNTFTGNAFVRNVLSGVFLACAVRDHEPAVRCWPGSMSAGNRFVRNRFDHDRVGFMVGADAAAACARRGFAPNRSRGDRFNACPREDPRARAFGRCVAYPTPAAARGGGAGLPGMRCSNPGQRHARTR